MNSVEWIKNFFADQIGSGKRFATRVDMARFLGLPQTQATKLFNFLKGSDTQYSAVISWFEMLGGKLDGDLSIKDVSKSVHFVNAKVINAGENLPQIIPDDYLAVPLCNETGAGAGVVQYDEFQSWFLVYKNEPSIRWRSNLIAVKIAKGSTSMLPTLAPEDIVLVDRGENFNPRAGKIYLVAEPDGSTKVKRVNIDIDKHDRETRIIFYSDNAAENPPEMYNLAEEYEGDITRAIIGRVVWAWSDVSEK